MSGPAWLFYQRKGLIEAMPWRPGCDMDRVSLSAADIEAGHPKYGGMIARNPANPDDRWYIAPEFFEKHYELSL